MACRDAEVRWSDEVRRFFSPLVRDVPVRKYSHLLLNFAYLWYILKLVLCSYPIFS